MCAKRAIIGVLKHQKEFAEYVGRYVALIGGYGSGKSFAVPLRTLQLIKRRRNKARVLVLSPTYRMSQDIILPLFRELFEAYGVVYSEHVSKSEIEVTMPNFAGTILFRTAQNYRLIKGLNVTDFIIDEFDSILYKNQILVWRESIARIRVVPDGTGAITTTPEGFKYSWELFVEGINNKPPIGRLINAKSYDNPFTGQQYIDDLYAQYDKQVAEQYIEGGFVDINSMPAYYGWDKVHLIKEYPTIGQHYLIGMDFNVDPMVAVVGEIGSGGMLYIFEEIILRNSNTEEMARVIANKYGNRDITIFPDLTSLKKRATNAPLGVSDIKILREPPFNFRIDGNRISTQRDRLNTVNAAFSHGKIKIAKSCKYLIKDINLSARADDGRIDKKRELPGKPWVHITDAAGYLIQRLFPITVRSSGRTVGA